MLYIVATPIGNLKDITLRALEVLKNVDLIAAEDTRHTRGLLSHYQITTPLTSYFEHNKFTKAAYLERILSEGKDIALVSDSGTPGVSDPGYRLIALAIKNHQPITTIPGPCALISGLILSGLPTDKFIFEGFMPVKGAARRKKIESIKDEVRTVIFYESPHRICKCLQDLAQILGEREIVIARELTKKFEEVVRAPADVLLAHFNLKTVKGEFVLMIKGKGK